MTPVKPGTLSRISSISRMIESSLRLWMMRPSCSVIEQKVQPPKQPRMMFTLKRIISQAGILSPSPYARVRRGARYGRSNTWSISAVVSGIGGGLIHTSRVAVRLHQRARVARVGFQVQHAVGVRIQHRVGATCS